jgi:hypothetical protein
MRLLVYMSAKATSRLSDASLPNVSRQKNRAVPNGNRRISFALQPYFDADDSPLRLVVRVSVGQDLGYDMLPGPLWPRSFISRQMLREVTIRLGPPARASDGSIVLGDLRIVGQGIPDLAVRVSAAPTRLRVDGILGFDFFQQFSEIIWQPASHEVTLVLPD